MATLPIDEIILSQAKKANLAPFYLVVGDNSQALEDWMRQLLAHFVAFVKNVQFDKALEKIDLGLSDLLWIRKPEERKEYSIGEDDLGEIPKFLQWKCIELSWRFVVVSDAHLIPERYLNKFLKILEEPGAKTSLFFLYGNEKRILETVQSRSIVIRPLNKPPLFKSLSQQQIKDYWKERGIELQQNHLVGVVNYFESIKNKKEEQQKTWNQLIDHILCFQHDFDGYDLQQMHSEITQSINEEIFHNSFQNRCHRMLELVLRACARQVDGKQQN
ncbi:MAG: hypothetical protein Fur0010_22140 [Bdellovibrio sp.]